MVFRLRGFSERARVIRGDLWASNGVVHIIDRLLDKPPVIVGSNTVSKSTGWPQNSKLLFIIAIINNSNITTTNFHNCESWLAIDKGLLPTNFHNFGHFYRPWEINNWRLYMSMNDDAWSSYVA